MGINAPILAVCPTSIECIFHIIVEQEPTCELTGFDSALIHLIATYFIYDIAYPKPFKALLLMLQHHILGFSDKQPDPSSVVEIVTFFHIVSVTFV